MAKRFEIMGIIKGKKQPLFNDGRTYSSKKYATKVMRDLLEWSEYDLHLREVEVSSEISEIDRLRTELQLAKDHIPASSDYWKKYAR